MITSGLHGIEAAMFEPNILNQSAASQDDPVTNEIIRNAFIATVRQCGRIILRSSFSPIIRDAFDFCVTLVAPPQPPDLDLDVVAMNESLAHFSGVMPFLVRNLVWEYGADNLEDGDLLALNNPYKGGNHIYDNCFFKPVFYEGRIIGALAVKAHLMDMGGISAGGYSVTKRSIWEEGVVISGIPVYKRNEPYVPGFDLYFDNSRQPDNMLADIQACFNSCRFGERRLIALVQKYGVGTVHSAMRYTLDMGDRSMRAGLARLQDGIFQGEDGLDSDGLDDGPYRVRCRIEKRGETVEVDFSGSTRQAATSINCSAYDTANGVYTALKVLFDPANPNNSGAYRSVDVVIPEGTFLSALPPAPTTMYFDAAEAVFNAVVKALLPGVGEHGFGGHFGTNMGLLYSGPVEGSPERIYVAPFFCLGPFGASRDGDGEPFVSMSQQNIMDMSVEAIEDDYPIIVLRKEFVCDSGGPGTFRGGPATRWDRALVEDAECTPLFLHQRILPWGAMGGHVGRSGGAWQGLSDDPLRWMKEPIRAEQLVPISGYQEGSTNASGRDHSGGKWVSAVKHINPAKAGTLVRVSTPGGGGYGNPFAREPSAVLRDVRDGFVSVEGAERDYGVRIYGDSTADPEGLAIDYARTSALRNGGPAG